MTAHILRPAGHCHCGAVQVDLEWARALEASVSSAGCAGVKTIADREGRA